MTDGRRSWLARSPRNGWTPPPEPAPRPPAVPEFPEAEVAEMWRVYKANRCGYCGGAKHRKGMQGHLRTPDIFCPKCGGEVRIIGGRECVIRSLKAKVDDVECPKATKRRRKNAQH